MLTFSHPEALLCKITKCPLSATLAGKGLMRFATVIVVFNSPFRSWTRDLGIARLTMYHGTVFGRWAFCLRPLKQTHDALLISLFQLGL